MWKNQILKNILLLVAAVIITVIALEILLRLFYPQNLNYTRISQTKIFENKPGISSILRRQEFTTHVRINSRGLRDKEYSLEKPENTIRIAFVGDSMVFGFGVELNETMGKLLESKLNSGLDKHYEVINFGVSAYGTEQEYIWIKDEVINYSPDIIILSFVTNDFKENVKYSLFDVKNNKLVANPPLKITPILKLRNYISWHSHLYSLIYFSVIDNQKLRNILIELKLLNPPIMDPSTDFDSLIYLNSKNKEFEYASNKTLLLLDEINSLALKNNIKLVIFLVPTKEQVDSSKMNSYIKFKNLDIKELNATKTQQIIKESLQKYNITIMDPFGQFKRYNVNNTFYYDIDGHWNKKGHQFVADIIYEDLIKSKLTS